MGNGYVKKATVVGGSIHLETDVRCGECDDGKKVIVISCCDIFTVCNRCGFKEYEWRCGDSLDYLDYMDRVYKVSLSYGKSLKYFVEAAINICGFYDGY